MDTTFDYLVTSDAHSDPIATDDIPLSSSNSEKIANISKEESILDLSQRPLTTETTNPNERIVFIDNWRESSTCNYTDDINDDLNRILILNNDQQFDMEQSLTDQLKTDVKNANALSDTTKQSQIDFYCSKKKTEPSSSSSTSIVIHELHPCQTSPSFPSSDFLWSKYFSLIGERSVSDEFFDHYLASIESGFKIDMKIEYCYDTEHDLYWITQIQLVSHSLLLLHYIGLPEDDTSSDFWTFVYDQRCHPIGWCKENIKSMSAPPVVAKRTSSQASANNINDVTVNGNDNINGTPPAYLFDKDIGLTPVEQLKVGMLFEIQDVNRPWTLWFARIITNRGGRLHLRYVTDMNDEEKDSSEPTSDIHLFYLDRRIHCVGWTSNNTSNYFYELPTSSTSTIDKQEIIEKCLTESQKQFLPPNLFKEQEGIVKHRFTEGMRIEVFQSESKNVHIGRIGSIHNEYYFDVIIENEGGNEVSFVAHSTHPHILPPHWAAEHKLALMNGKGIRQSEDYWNLYTEKNGIGGLAPERCFNLITLNAAGANQVEPGMKMEMIYALNDKDLVFSVTLIHVVDHLMWLRVDDTRLLHNENLVYHVLPINSLDVFPVGWAKFNGFELITPIQYQMDIQTYERNQYNLFSSVTHYPKIPRVYLNEVYQLTIYVNIRCFCGPHLCSSRLARIPSQFGPGPYRHVLIDVFHHLLSASSANAHRALRRLDHQTTPETASTMKTESVKAWKKSSKLIRPISIPNEPRLVYQFLRHICTQLEACPNLISIQHLGHPCPDQCHILTNTFAFSTHSRHKRTQLRAAQNRYRKRKSLLGHLKAVTPSSNVQSPVVEELPAIELSIDSQMTIESTANDLARATAVPLPGSDRQTRGFRVHIEPKTHTVTRTNRRQKLMNNNNGTLTIDIKQEPVEMNHITSESSSSSSSLTTHLPAEEPKRPRLPRKKRSLSPSIVSPPSFTSNILSTSKTPSSPSSKSQKRRRPAPVAQSLSDRNSSSTYPISKVEIQQPPSPLIRPVQYSIPPPIDPRNPVTWNVNDVCWYLNESGCSFALKVIKEQEIDGAALLLLDDLKTVQNLLEFKLGPAVKFFHVVEQLRTQVIDTFNSSSTSSLRTSSRLSTK